MLLDILDRFGSYMEQGGVVMWPLLVATVLVWFGIGSRLVGLRRGSRLPVRELIEACARDRNRVPRGYVDRAAGIALRVRELHGHDIRHYLDDELFSLREDMSRYRTLVRTIVLVAPLAGLLGTVSGMIEMFDSLGSQTFYSQSGGVANGISQALFTTQFGLVIAVPAMIVGRLLDRRETSMRSEIEQIKDYFCSPETEAA